MGFDENLRRLVALSAPYWAGEMEVVRTYFHSPLRTRERDILWLRRQCFKEMWGSGVGDRDRGLFQWRAAYLANIFDGIDRSVDRHAVLRVIDDLRTEFSHYCLFADIYDVLSDTKLDPAQLEGWPADDELTRLRYACRDRYKLAGDLAVASTEGGYGAMYAVGMELGGMGGINARIARACEQVYADEIGHARHGLVGLARQELPATQWEELAEAITAVLRQRLRMRNEQFSYPVSPERLRALDAGGAAPLAFDYRGIDGAAAGAEPT